MVNYWLFIITEEEVNNKRIPGIKIFKTLIKKGVWGLGERTPNRKNIEEGDKIIFYCGGGSGAFSYTFVGTASVKEAPKLKPDREEFIVSGENIANYPYEVKLKNIKIWSHPKPIKHFRDKLSIIKNSDRWGIYLQGGIIRLSKEDYRLICMEEKFLDIEVPEEKSPQSMGAWFERHIASFVKKMGFKDIKMHEDFEGPHQVDVVGGFREYLFLIECKWRRKDTAPHSVKDYVTSIRGKIPSIKKSAKKHKVYSKYSKYIFVLATRNHEISKKDREYSQNVNLARRVYLWDEKFVDYYTRLHSILGPYSIYNMLRLSRIRF